MLQNAYFLAKIGADTAENEQHFAEILPKIGNYPTGRLTPWRRAEPPEARERRAGEERRRRAAPAAARGEVVALLCEQRPPPMGG